MKKILLVLLLSVVVISCKKDDDNGNANCADPNGLVIDLLGSTNVKISWGTGGETAWQIEYGPTGFELGTGTVIQTSQISYLITGLEPGTGYEVYLRSNCGSDGFSDYITLDFVTLTGNPNCNAPSDLNLGLITSSTVEFSWAENNETAWQIEYGISGFTIGTGTVVETSQNIYTITGLSPSTTYEIYVRANCGSDGYSEYSDALVVTTTP
jgi:hypothetical protein